jgi:hypothetical protein
LSLQRVVAGADPGSTIVLRQLGAPGDVTDDGVPILSVGKQYLIFVTPFEFHAAQPTGQYSPTADAGICAVTAGGALTRLAAQSALPGNTTVALVAAALR